jgi:hypothetical protein
VDESYATKIRLPRKTIIDESFATKKDCLEKKLRNTIIDRKKIA